MKDFVRLAFTVTMVPRSTASEEIIEKRKKGFMERIGCTHWPNQFQKSIMGGYIRGVKVSEFKYDWPDLT